MTKCELCDKDTDELNHQMEDMVIKMIREENPQWIESDGACKECIKYYSGLDEIVEIFE